MSDSKYLAESASLHKCLLLSISVMWVERASHNVAFQLIKKGNKHHANPAAGLQPTLGSELSVSVWVPHSAKQHFIEQRQYGTFCIAIVAVLMRQQPTHSDALCLHQSSVLINFQLNLVPCFSHTHSPLSNVVILVPTQDKLNEMKMQWFVTVL